VAFSDEVGAGRVLVRRFMGEDIVVYRTQRGVLRVVEPYCPHLGAHLGYGGTVEAEDIVCPFHRFAFDTTGSCVRTSYGTRPPEAKLGQMVSQEKNGVILVWRHAAGMLPEWEVPDIPTNDFPVPVRHAYTIVDHPQEVVENVVDIGHVVPLHHYRDARVTSPMAPDGPRFRIGQAAKRVFPAIGDVEVLYDVEVHGLGYMWVTAKVPRFRAAALIQAMATPIDPCHIELRFTASIRTGASGSPPTPANAVLSRMLTVLLAKAFWRDLSLDFRIWENKRYQEVPRLAVGDGPIVPFRRWARQFYPDGATNGHSTSEGVDPGGRWLAVDDGPKAATTQ
jgi:phenylpropionate dioxygenase-like ring-hydroxylating dioxygenase large terminal subunit